MPTKLKIKQVYPEPASKSTVQADYVDLTSDQIISGSKTFTDYSKYVLADNTSETQFAGIRIMDSNNDVLAAFRGKHYSNGARTAQMGVFGTNSESGVIECTVNSSGVVYTSAPTPSTSDNSTKIATTAYVKSNLSDYLPLSGGTMTGAIILQTPTNRIFSLSNHGTNDPNFTNIDFGWNYANRDGAGAAFRSADYTPSAGADAGTTRHSGAFAFYTRNATSTYNLTGLPSGTLTWEGSTFKIGSSCTLQYNSTNQCLDFIFT